jgi:hypothetical protein
MLHSEVTYKNHPVRAGLLATAGRGTGCELRLQGCDPDRAEERARSLSFRVLQAASNKPHGLRECFLMDGDGYVWVPSVVSEK